MEICAVCWGFEAGKRCVGVPATPSQEEAAHMDPHLCHELIHFYTVDHSSLTKEY